ncbi:MAG: 2-C-methyl-D-erythritol 4-phosphate cytidylyltransferase [candidate division KSB1 bacterium]|nr:2-C-methyl-D-erythritol 4-phosphate cytidylyltransferase [candidate division KSB1 bacterium]
MHKTAIIVAAGSGQRMRCKTPKQFIEIAGKPILQHTLQVFESCDDIDDILVVLPPEWVSVYDPIFRSDWKISKLMQTVAGAGQRHLSVWNGLQALPDDTEIVIIHDGVRPLITRDIIRNSIYTAARDGAAVVGVQSKDTIKRVKDTRIVETIPRDDLILVQTPQTFRKDVILAANRSAFDTDRFSTDDAALAEMAGYPVTLVPGIWTNIKITSPEDLKVAEWLLRERSQE